MNQILRIGCVSYLNSRPFAWGLERRSDCRLIYAVPANLLPLLDAGECDLALLPAIDYQRRDDLLIIPGAGIAADGHVWTVRLFSRVPIAQIQRIYADIDSHTSIALCRIILKLRYGIEPQLTSNPRDAVDADLLIGDKVICSPPHDAIVHLDLADEWKQMTGLPFVFALWMTRRGTPLPANVAQILLDALSVGLAHVDDIVASDAVSRGWPPALARDYLAHLLKLRVNPFPSTPQRQALDQFYSHAVSLDLVPRTREIELTT